MNERRCRGVVQKVTPTCMASTEGIHRLREHRPTKKRQKIVEPKGVEPLLRDHF